MNYKLFIIMLLGLTIACGAPAGFKDDAGDPPDADPSGDAADDHKTGVKFDGGEDADADPGDGGTTSDASDSGQTTGVKRVFTTAPNEYYVGTGTGKFSGLAGADAVCQSRATTANLGGTWKAWLSSSTSSAAQRLAHNGSPYQLVDGTVIAYNWAELTSGTLAHLIDQNELGEQWTSAVFWTSSSASGAALTSTCSDWTSNSAAAAVEYGYNSFADSRWTDEAPTTCADHMSFYCFEQ